MQSLNGYTIRSLDSGNLADVELLNLMYYHPIVMSAKGYSSLDPHYAQKVDLHEAESDIMAAHSRVKRKVSDVVFAIADKANHLAGYIWFYTDKKHPLPVSVVKAHGLTPKNSRVYQVSYEKLMSDGWPRDLVNKMVVVKKEHLTIPRKRVVMEGLAMAITRLHREYHALYTKKRSLVLYGYVQPENVASCKVLESNGFAKTDRLYSYDGVPHQLWVRII